MIYETVYCIKWYNFASIIYFLIIMLSVLIFILFHYGNRFKERRVKVVLIGITVFISLFIFSALISHYYKLFEYINGNFEIVEGKVTEFESSKINPKGIESFKVDDILFMYSNSLIAGGFNKTNSVGGPIHENMQVRITYKNGIILKIETKNK